MNLIAVTRLRLRKIVYLPPFLWTNYLVSRQITRSPGFIRGKLLVDKDLTFWTLTQWQDEVSMRAFVSSTPHRSAMPKLGKWCDEAAVAYWFEELDVLPDWNKVYQNFMRLARATPLPIPSGRHLNGEYCHPRLVPLIETPLNRKFNKGVHMNSKGTQI